MLASVLRKVEWSYLEMCPCCGGTKPGTISDGPPPGGYGHGSSCELALCIRQLEGQSRGKPAFPQRHASWDDKDVLGLYDKFEVIRADGSKRHRDCRYFVLDVLHDQFARDVLYFYAARVEQDRAALAADLRAELRHIEKTMVYDPKPKCRKCRWIDGSDCTHPVED